MNKADRWLLPDGIEELLPADARQLEAMRRRLVDQFRLWGYDYVIPPLVEFTDSLLTGSGQDISLLTFKLTDQLSGKTMGIRADITPQVARMDAHSQSHIGVNRLCYAGHVMHTRPKAQLSSRTPIQAGVELFGEPSLDADIEVLSLLIATLETAGLSKQYLDLGHVGVYRAILKAVDFSTEQESVYLELIQSKALPDLKQWLLDQNLNEQHLQWLEMLPALAGGVAILEQARMVFESAPEELHMAIDELEVLAGVIGERYPLAQLYFDLSELRGYNYHTGLVFGAFAPGFGNAIASGGRYDCIGKAFGRSRPATGFAVDLTAINRLLGSVDTVSEGIFAVSSNNAKQWKEIQNLRAQGHRVVNGLSGQVKPYEYQLCNQQLVEIESGFVLRPLAN